MLNRKRQKALLNYLIKEPDTEDIAVIKEWENENPNELLEYKDIWNKADILNERFFADPDLGWEQVNEKLTNRKKSTPLWIYKVAATITVLAAFSFALYQFLKPTTFITHNNTELLELEDQSEILLNTNSEIEILNFNEQQRQILLRGEAYFDVARDEKRPFIINTNKGIVKVLGTDFNILSSDEKLVVSVAEGQVQVNSGTNSETLLAGESVEVAGLTFEKKPNDLNYISWKTGVLLFDNHSANYVLATLSKHYEVNITNEADLENCRLSARYEHTSLQEILNELLLVWNIKIEQENNRITVSGIGCDKGGE